MNYAFSTLYKNFDEKKMKFFFLIAILVLNGVEPSMHAQVSRHMHAPLHDDIIIFFGKLKWASKLETPHSSIYSNEHFWASTFVDGGAMVVVLLLFV